MALLPNTIIYGATGSSSSPTEKKNGGTAVGITSTTSTANGQPITRTFPLTSNAIEGAVRKPVPVAASGAGHAFSTQKAYTSGTFAYTQSQFMVIGLATKINNVANTELLMGASVTRPKTLISNKMKGAKTSTAYRAGYWNAFGISGQRTNWSTAPSTASASYVLPTNNASNADDQAQFVTYRTVPGELVYMYGTIDPKLKDYAGH